MSKRVGPRTDTFWHFSYFKYTKKILLFQDIKSYCPDILGNFPYPIIADPKRELAVKFGMLDDKDKDNISLAQTVRALFIISPDKTVRLTMHYPTSCGRNVEWV